MRRTPQKTAFTDWKKVSSNDDEGHQSDVGIKKLTKFNRENLMKNNGL